MLDKNQLAKKWALQNYFHFDGLSQEIKSLWLSLPSIGGVFVEFEHNLLYPRGICDIVVYQYNDQYFEIHLNVSPVGHHGSIFLSVGLFPYRDYSLQRFKFNSIASFSKKLREMQRGET